LASLARQGAEPQVTADRAANHPDGAGAPLSAIPENELPNCRGLDCRDQDRPGLEQTSQKPRHDPTALLSRIQR
jgi:hypothetical protein